MGKHGKRYSEAAAAVGVEDHAPDVAVKLAKEFSKVKFPEAVELHIATSADPRHSDQQIREVAELPHGTGKNVRVLVFAQGDAARDAQEAGAEFVADDEIIKKIEGGWSEFDVAIATPDQMGKIGRLGRYLGRKGLMPNPRTGTVVQPDRIAAAVEGSKKGRAEIRLDRGANIHVRIGTVDFDEQQLLDNLSSVYSTILRSKPEGVKGALVKKATICTTMGPSIHLDQGAMEALTQSN
ncbi:MAG: 50S ribosomal protein L1 [Chloroflexi bacterium]|nr:50S ribosomal protein L1 [Chloroflexota bacterium]|tara:strand:+ start:3044 stop:3757 length:714 start_codon:yes stop_codon:yes gene_type:complete